MADTTSGWRRGLEQVLFQNLRKELALSTRSFQTSGLQTCERLHFRCFRPPGLWCFVTAAPGDSYRR